MIKNLKKGRTASVDLFVRSLLEVGVPRDAARLKRIRSAGVIETHMGIRSDYLRLCAASYIAELVTRCVQEDDPEPGVFGLVCLALGMLEKGEGIYRTLLFFEVRFLKELGMAPDVRTCGRCGGMLAGDVVIDPSRGGFAHAGCRQGGPAEALSPGDLSVLRYILGKDVGALARLTVGEDRAGNIFRQVSRFSIHHLGFSPRTAKTLP